MDEQVAGDNAPRQPPAGRSGPEVDHTNRRLGALTRREEAAVGEEN